MKKKLILSTFIVLTFPLFLVACTNGNDAATDDATYLPEENYEQAEDANPALPEDEDVEDVGGITDTTRDEILSIDLLSEIAISYVDGVIEFYNIDWEGGVQYFEVRIREKVGGGIVEVYINAGTGELIRIDWD